MKNIKTIFLTILFCFLQTGFCFAEVQTYWDYGEFELVASFGKDSDLSANLELLDFFFVEQKTGLYASISPMRVDFPLEDEKKIERDDAIAFAPGVFTFVNANVGWIKPLSELFYLEFFVNCSTLNPMDIKYVSFKAGTEISIAAGLPDKVEADFPCIGKAVSLETGVLLSNRDWSAPKYYIALDFNFAIFVYLWKNETCN